MSSLRTKYQPNFGTMAEQCASARLPEPVVCCGTPVRNCGVHVCSIQAQSHRKFYEAGESYAAWVTRRDKGHADAQ